MTAVSSALCITTVLTVFVATVDGLDCVSDYRKGTIEKNCKSCIIYGYATDPKNVESSSYEVFESQCDRTHYCYESYCNTAVCAPSMNRKLCYCQCCTRDGCNRNRDTVWMGAAKSNSFSRYPSPAVTTLLFAIAIIQLLL